MINVVSFCGIFVTIIFIDHVGPRPLAIWGAIGMGVATAIIAAIYAYHGNSWMSLAGCVLHLFVCLPTSRLGDVQRALMISSDVHTVIFGLIYVPLIWCMLSELFQNVSPAQSTSNLHNTIAGVKFRQEAKDYKPD